MSVEGTALSAQKNINCLASAGLLTCIAIGQNANAIADGQIATATAQIASGYGETSIPMALTASAADPSGGAVALMSVGSTITITPTQSPWWPVSGFQTSHNDTLSSQFHKDVAAGHSLLVFLTWIGLPGKSVSCSDSLGTAFSAQLGVVDTTTSKGAAYFTGPLTKSGQDSINCTIGAAVTGTTITIVEIPATD
jgi:hypothetical protein